jgi:bifunctional non-homologous end joining protein LigD
MSAMFVHPCIPTVGKTIPKGDGWLHELKFDGYRFQIVKGTRATRLYSRNGYDWTKRLPGFAAAFQRLPGRTAVLDGELVLPDEDGAPDFEGLRTSVRETQEHELVFFAFDLLYRDGKDLRPLPLIERKRRLVRLVGRTEISCLHLVETFDDGEALLRAAERHALEGIVSKRRDAPYRSGDCRDWVKLKTAAWREVNRERWRMFENS